MKESNDKVNWLVILVVAIIAIIAVLWATGTPAPSWLGFDFPWQKTSAASENISITDMDGHWAKSAAQAALTAGAMQPITQSGKDVTFFPDTMVTVEALKHTVKWCEQQTGKKAISINYEEINFATRGIALTVLKGFGLTMSDRTKDSSVITRAELAAMLSPLTSPSSTTTTSTTPTPQIFAPDPSMVVLED